MISSTYVSNHQGIFFSFSLGIVSHCFQKKVMGDEPLTYRSLGINLISELQRGRPLCWCLCLLYINLASFTKRCVYYLFFWWILISFEPLIVLCKWLILACVVLKLACCNVFFDLINVLPVFISLLVSDSLSVCLFCCSVYHLSCTYLSLVLRCHLLHLFKSVGTNLCHLQPFISLSLLGTSASLCLSLSSLSLSHTTTLVCP